MRRRTAEIRGAARRGGPQRLPCAPGGRAALLCALALAGCAAPLDPAIKVLVSSLPAEATALRIRASRDGMLLPEMPELDLAPLAGQSQGRFVLSLPAGSRGALRIYVRALGGGCVRGQGVGELALQDVPEMDLPVALEPVAPCAAKTPLLQSSVPGTAPTDLTGVVLLRGVGFLPGTRVKIGGKDAAARRTSSSELQVTLPDLRGAHGPVPVRVIGPDGEEDVRDDLLRLRPGTILFQQQIYDIDSSPRTVATADLDGDGDLDVVTANELVSTVAVSMNKGDGSLEPPVPYAENRNGIFVTAAGRAGGRPDLFVLGQSAGALYARVLRNNGKGSFVETGREERSIGRVSQRDGRLAVGDLRGTGALDIVVASPDNGAFRILMQGDGTYGSGALTEGDRIPVDFAPYLVTLADLDQDGDLDVVFRDTVQVGTALNDHGTFPEAGYRSFRLDIANGLGSCLALGDLDGDRFPDMAAQDPNGDAVKIYLNRGMDPPGGQWMGFKTPKSYPVGRTPYCPVIADLDADGAPDLAVLNQLDNTVTILLGRGDGSFPTVGEPGRTTVPIGTGAGPRSGTEASLHMIAADLNRDGLPDLVVPTFGTGAKNLAILLNASR